MLTMSVSPPPTGILLVGYSRSVAPTSEVGGGLTDMVSKSKGHQTPVTSYYEPETVQQLKKLSEATRIPQAAYLREALDDLLKKYAMKSPKTKG